MALDLVLAEPLFDRPHDQHADRRAHARIPARDLHWLRGMRLRHGPLLSVVDLSRGGVQLQGVTQLRPGSTAAIEIVGQSVVTVPTRILRCHVVGLGAGGPVYRGACEFVQPIALGQLQTPTVAQPARLDLALKELLAVSTVNPSAPALLDLPARLRALQSAASNDPLGRAIRSLLSELVPAIDRGEPAAALRVRLEEHLRRVVPAAAIAIGAERRKPTRHAETVYFTSGEPGGASDIINVELPDGSRMQDWQFRLLQAGGYLLGLVRAVGAGLQTENAVRSTAVVEEVEARRQAVVLTDAPAETRAEITRGWQKIVVRYRDGRLLKGFSHDFHPTRRQFSLWPSIDAAPSERVHIPLSQLKAVFFVREFGGDPNRIDQQDFEGWDRTGRRIEVSFSDGEVLLGSTLNYQPDGLGFFVTPADKLANNQRVFVVAGALHHVRFF